MSPSPPDDAVPSGPAERGPSERGPVGATAGGDFRIRPVARADLEEVLALNNRCAPAALTAETYAGMRWYMDAAPYFHVVEAPDEPTDAADARPGARDTHRPSERSLGGRVAAFLVAFVPEDDYHSGNHAWFRARYDDFVYVDRIAVGEAFRGRGLGRLLYDHLVEWARARGAARLACEVNVEPRNEGSLAFHERTGFRPLEERRTEYGPRVVMMERPLATG